MIDNNAKILLIYTGGTIGMVENVDTGILEPFDFNYLTNHLPELKRFAFKVDHIVFQPLIDSSDVKLEHWVRMVKIIEEHYDRYDGFVILHGTDTMAYTASALSFMIEGLDKPIVLTGAQLPIGKLRTDAKENLITALEIAADKDASGKPMLTEVCIFFQTDLMRGNRTSKTSADNFNAFRSFNYPNLGKSGIEIKYNDGYLLPPVAREKIKFHYCLDDRVIVLRLFPGINEQTVRAILSIKDLKGVVLETYGCGNGPLTQWFLDLIKDAVDRGIVIVNLTQCKKGSVDMTRYDTGMALSKAGVISGYDSTMESLLTKLMLLFGHQYCAEEIKDRMSQSLTGEITLPEESL